MRARLGVLAISLAIGAGTSLAQTAAVPDTSTMYCSGLASKQPPSHDMYLISGEQSNYQITFNQGALVYINKGASQGVKDGDEFLVTRAVSEPLDQPWFKGQPALAKAMGTLYADLGRIKVVHAGPKMATAQIIFSCAYMQRGDIVTPATERPAPPMKSNANFDRFAAPSGKSMAMIVLTRDFGQLLGNEQVGYVNLGSAQGVKVGDYFRIFRYQGANRETVYQTAHSEYEIYGFGSTPVRYTGKDLPREVLGEAIVLRVSPNSATIMVTLNVREIYAGDLVEIE